jgi:hypothetical protein
VQTACKWGTQLNLVDSAQQRSQTLNTTLRFALALLFALLFAALLQAVGVAAPCEFDMEGLLIPVEEAAGAEPYGAIAILQDLITAMVKYRIQAAQQQVQQTADAAGAATAATSSAAATHAGQVSSATRTAHAVLGCVTPQLLQQLLLVLMEVSWIVRASKPATSTCTGLDIEPQGHGSCLLFLVRHACAAQAMPLRFCCKASKRLAELDTACTKPALAVCLLLPCVQTPLLQPQLLHECTSCATTLLSAAETQFKREAPDLIVAVVVPALQHLGPVARHLSRQNEGQQQQGEVDEQDAWFDLGRFVVMLLEAGNPGEGNATAGCR